MAYDEAGNAVFTAGAQAGDFTVTASDGVASGSAPIKVVDQLSRLSVTRKDTGSSVSSLTLSPGDTVDLDASGTWYNISVAMGDEDVTWTADPAWAPSTPAACSPPGRGTPPAPSPPLREDGR